MSIFQKIKDFFKRENKDDAMVIEASNAEDLAEQQKIIDKLYAEQGGGDPSDEVLEMQVALNKKRNELDIPDGNNLVNGDFVQ